MSAVAFCKLHKKNMSVKNVKFFKCINGEKQKNKTQCIHLKKYDHPYWEMRDRIKELKKQRKENSKTY